MENTIKNKIKFFGQYIDQEVGGLFGELSTVDNFYLALTRSEGNTYLELKSISLITDEDAVKLGYGNAKHLRSNLLYNKDELRQLGYAIDWCGLSVDKLQKYGWIKLKENATD